MRIFIGHDSRHKQASKVCKQSILNYWPDADRLCEKMKRKEGSAAYCCQCSSISVSDIMTVDRHDENLKWKGIE